MKHVFAGGKFVALWVPVFILLCMLGKWQLSRYHFKRHLVEAASGRLARPAIPFSALQAGHVRPEAFLRLSVLGFYQNDSVILIQNQFYHHQSGVEVLTPLYIPGDKKWLLVDRGWHALSSPQAVPSIVPVQGAQQIKGYLMPRSEYQFILGKNIQNPNQRPLQIQKIDLPELSRLLSHDFYPFILKLDADVPSSFERDPQTQLVLPVPPERHLGYAFQWFAMAAVLLVACLFYGFYRWRETKDGQQ